MNQWDRHDVLLSWMREIKLTAAVWRQEKVRLSVLKIWSQTIGSFLYVHSIDFGETFCECIDCEVGCRVCLWGIIVGDFLSSTLFGFRKVKYSLLYVLFWHESCSEWLYIVERSGVQVHLLSTLSTNVHSHLFTVCVCVCVCVREREREHECVGTQAFTWTCVCLELLVCNAHFFSLLWNAI